MFSLPKYFSSRRFLLLSHLAAGGRCFPVGPPPLISPPNSSLCRAKGSSLPPCSSCSSSRRIVARSGDKNDVWVCPQRLWREGEVVIVRMLAGGAVVLVDLGFVLRWFWVRFATGACRNEVRRCLFSSGLPPPLLSPVSSFGRKFRASPSYSHGLR
ncbi:hypothetical protein F2Q68_00007039 [Brassica cretica]|uniref:Uncharacterized protein n=1 Tax=Brassica cretica TaxID=69181 RepID=A0A8S9KVM2_BRACR|nr:hypothetical protein F2Q68_00007039 [Brassica cretica]